MVHSPGKAEPGASPHDKRVVQAAGRIDVCSICGDDPAPICKLTKPRPSGDVLITLRLCDDCRSIRKSMHQETYIPV